MRKFRDMIAHSVDTPKSRLASLLYRDWVDHGILRHLWGNMAEIDDGVFRANHPPEWRLRRFKRAGGVSVLSLRGGENLAPGVLERDACARLGLEYYRLTMTSTRLPKRETVLALVELLDTVPRPVLMHCKSGADRTGLASGIYLMAFKGMSPKKAVKQLTIRHSHIRFSKKAVLHDFFALYQPAYDAGQGFVDWVRDVYDPEAGAANG